MHANVSEEVATETRVGQLEMEYSVWNPGVRRIARKKCDWACITCVINNRFQVYIHILDYLITVSCINSILVL